MTPQANGPGQQYRAFISYSHADRAYARKLQAFLEGYRPPAGLRVPGQPVHPLAPVFLDETELTSGDLSRDITDAIAASRALVVVCSPAAAASPWVDLEVRRFKQAHGPSRVYALLVAGASAQGEHGGDEDGSFPPALLRTVAENGELTGVAQPPLAADLRPGHGSQRMAFLRIAAALLGVGLDRLVHREQQRRTRRVVAALAVTGGIALLTSALALQTWLAQREAEHMRAEAERMRGEADNLISFMLGDLRDRLEPIGRTDVLDAVGDRALAYFQSLSDANDDALALEQRALATRQIGEVRIQQGRIEEALVALDQSLLLFQRANTLDAGNPDRVLQLGHAHFWVADVYLRQGDQATATRHIEQYRDLAGDLVALDPSVPAYQEEWASAHTNLGVLAYRSGDFVAARTNFQGALVATRQLQGQGNAGLQRTRANNLGWLAAAEQALAGTAAAGLPANREAVAIFARLFEAHQDKADLNSLVQARRALAANLANDGRLDLAQQEDTAAVAEARQLVATDPDNMSWQQQLANSLASRLRHGLQTCPDAGRLADLGQWAQEAETLFLRAQAVDPIDQGPGIRLAALQGDQAWLALHQGQADNALVLARTAYQHVRGLAAAGRTDSSTLRWLASTGEALAAALIATDGQQQATRHKATLVDLLHANAGHDLDTHQALARLRAPVAAANSHPADPGGTSCGEHLAPRTPTSGPAQGYASSGEQT